MSEGKEFKDVSDKIDLAKTEGIFDSLIHRSKINDKNLPFDDNEVKKAKAVLGAGNLHINSARVKVGALRLIGYRDNLKQLSVSIKRRAKNARRPRD